MLERLNDWWKQQRLIMQAHKNRGEFKADYRRYNKYTSLVESDSLRLTGENLEGQLTRDYHRVEKGLALADPKRPFGEHLLTRLNRLIPVGNRVAPGAIYVDAAMKARDALVEWNSKGNVDGEVAPISPPAKRDTSGDVKQFFSSRRSVRNFSSEPIDMVKVYDAVSCAVHSPSVCNRQPWKVRLYSGQDVIRMLAHQNGNSGFTENVPLLALISVEVGYFFGAGERNQAWIEGGIFSSSLVWALHAMGFHTCMLNLSITNEKADALRGAAEMPDSELPIMMIAIGHGAEGHRVARSQRRSVGEIVREYDVQSPAGNRSDSGLST